MEKNSKFYTDDKSELLPESWLCSFGRELTSAENDIYIKELRKLNKEGIKSNYSCKILQFVFRDNYQEMKERILKYDGISEDD